MDQQTSAYAQLLSDPEFNFVPYFDEAVMNWLALNMNKFLTEQPGACKYFMKLDQHFPHVAEAISLDDDSKIIEFLKILERSDAWTTNRAFATLTRRLNEVNKIDLIVNVPKLAIKSPDIGVLERIGDETVRTIANQLMLDLRGYMTGQWDPEALCVLFRKMPQDVLTTFISNDFLNAYLSEPRKSRIISVIAQNIAKEQVQTFMEIFGNKYQSLQCMKCTNKIAKSKPGYTLHRKKCDPTYEFPSIFDAIAAKLK